MENAETMHAAAARETHEEACAEVANLSLYALYNLPHINQVYIIFRGQLVGGKASPGDESLEVALMDEADVPWTEIAFPVIKENLKQYFTDQCNDTFVLHYGDMQRLSDNNYQIKRY